MTGLANRLPLPLDQSILLSQLSGHLANVGWIIPKNRGKELFAPGLSFTSDRTERCGESPPRAGESPF